MLRGLSFSYDSQWERVEEDQYDYGTAPSLGPLLRKTSSTYQGYSGGIRLLDQRCKEIVYDGGNNRVAETDSFFDGGIALCGAAGTPSVTGVSNLVPNTHDETNYGTSSTVSRGNLTTMTMLCFQGSTTCSQGNSTDTYTYDETGQILSKKDACGNGSCPDMTGAAHTTTYSYADNYTILSGGVNVAYSPSASTNAYLTNTTDPLGHSETFTYDFNNGQLTAVNDQNSQSTTYVYNDSFSRPTQFNYPDGGQTTFSYSDAAPNPTVTTSKLISSGTSLTTVNVMDGVGHSVQTQLTADPEGPDYTDIAYDGMSRIHTRSNPHRSTSSTTDGTTTYTYDALGRTTKIMQPDGSFVATSYLGNQTTATDEAGNQRRTQSDGLGRLTDAWEAPNVSGYNFNSHYLYSALNDLLCAVQKGTDTSAFSTCATASANWRPRSFMYDSLSRLTSATNPESGNITYSYDANGNLSSKVAPKPNPNSTGTVTTT